MAKSSRPDITMMNNWLEIFQAIGAILNGHFRLASGLHSDQYINKDELTKYPYLLDKIAREIARLLRLASLSGKIDVVTAPPVGAIGLGSRVTAFLNEGCRGIEGAVFVYPDKNSEGFFYYKRNFPKDLAGANVVLVEDIVTTGGSVKKTIDAVKAAGGKVVAVVAICDRSSGKVTAESLGVEFCQALLTLQVNAWKEDELPDDLKKIPVSQEVGHGAKV